MFTFNKKTFAFMSGLFAMAAVLPAKAENEASATFQPVADVASGQAQIVYFRAPTSTDAKNADIYVDGEFHTALVPASYTAFCVAAGQHTLGSYIGDDPFYKGKKENLRQMNLEAGKTYYAEVDESNQNVLNVLEKSVAEPALMSTKAQRVYLSRASAVKPCQYLYNDVNLAGDVLFNFGQYSEANIKPEGRDAIDTVATKAASSDAKVTIIGHTDPIGSESSNLSLGLKRAQTVRNIFIEKGVNPDNITASSAGSKEALVQGCSSLPRTKKISCYAPDRRVVVRFFKN